MRAFAAFAALIGAASATLGVDVSQLFPVSSWSCMVGQGYKFAIIRCYCSTGAVDSNCAKSVANAWSGGMSNVDAYMFPCPSCGNAAGQAKELKDYITSNSVNVGLIWLDIEGTQYWLGDTTSNRNFMNEMASALDTQFGADKWQIYANKYQWTSIFGEWTDYSHKQLWWAYYDYTADLTANWVNFCGWTKPAIKQYQGTDSSMCSMSIDHNVY